MQACDLKGQGHSVIDQRRRRWTLGTILFLRIRTTTFRLECELLPSVSCRADDFFHMSHGDRVISPGATRNRQTRKTSVVVRSPLDQRGGRT